MPRLLCLQVVALYPGACYTPLQYRQIPGYPKIDRDNSYLIGRFDGVVLDAKPWGRGREQLGGSPWPTQPRNDAEAALGLLEVRDRSPPQWPCLRLRSVGLLAYFIQGSTCELDQRASPVAPSPAFIWELLPWPFLELGRLDFGTLMQCAARATACLLACCRGATHWPWPTLPTTPRQAPSPTSW